MDYLEIEGGVRLGGRVEISGAKPLKISSASLT